jgi:hypothetical protein
VVAASPPLARRPSRVAQAHPPGPGLPEHAPSVHTSSAPSAAGISGRGAFALLFVAVRSAGAAARVPDDPAHAACAQRSPARAISSPGWTADPQTPQVVAYFAVIGTGSG